MQRIYGYAFFTKEELDAHLHNLEEAKRRDHRKLGRELDLFSIADETGAGLILWHPKGGFIRKQIEDFWRDEHLARRLRHRLLAAHRQHQALEDQRAHRVLQGQHVLAHRHRGRRVPVEADELPVPHHDLQVEAAQLPRAAVPLRGARHRLPLRALRRAARPDARARLHPGRRAPVLPPRPARGGDRPRHRLRDLDAVAPSASRSTTSTSPRKPEKAAGSDEQWEIATAALKRRRWRRAASPYTIDPGEGVVLRAQDRHQDQGLAGPRVAVLDHPGGLPQPATASGSSTSARTASRTSR